MNPLRPDHDPDGNPGGDHTSPMAADGDARPSLRSRPTTRRHLLVLGIAVTGIVVGVLLVVTGRDDGGSTLPSDTGVTVARGPLLPTLGTVDDEATALALMGDLDVKTLEPVAGADPTTTVTPDASPSDVDLTETGLQRCQQAIAQQNTDRSLGRRLAAARLLVGRLPTFVVSYELPASGDSPAGHRMVLTDARTCRVLGAVDS